ncbi:Elongation factor P [Candidatus Cyrtobacter comes]|uniref:Elongation factor P n=1 Tax=Candidatus Cyrtobacter comes TaxID=675776 RepID=A0ABU5L7C1_9RICK|nr:elongation factor P [Candidatus Cyrtobacter comes]MDZ5762023.1 Elongation factor P [Candidatus Cyrtobacter comes]
MKANDIRVNHVLHHQNGLWIVLKTMHTQPGKGGAYMQVEMKNIKDGTKLNVRFRSSETVEKAHIEHMELPYLYTDDQNIYVMDLQSYEQLSIPKTLLTEEALKFLGDGIKLSVQIYEGVPVTAFLPEKLEVEVDECEPTVKGQTASSSYKPAILKNGVKILVPQFIKKGEKIIIRTENMEYVEKVQ